MDDYAEFLLQEAALFAPVYRATDQPDHQPGFHALIIGVSRYPHLPLPGQPPTQTQQRHGLGLEQLTCAATTGYRIYRWLLDRKDDLPQPLLTCRLLLAPTSEEEASVEGLAQVASGAALQQVLRAARAWRADSATRANNHTFFYFAGHGFLRRGNDLVLVLEDIGDSIGGMLTNAIEVSNLVGGMTLSDDYPQLASTQLYFFDSCRLPLADGYQWEEHSCTDVWPVPVNFTAPMRIEYYTAEPGRSAFAIRNEQTVFSRALLDCLHGGGAEEVSTGRWSITVSSLNACLSHYLEKVAKEVDIPTPKFYYSAPGGQIILADLADPPEVELTVRVVPDDASVGTKLTISDMEKQLLTCGPPLSPHPYRQPFPVGVYKATTYLNGGEKEHLRALKPPFGTWELELDSG
jgi:Caspase domain